MPVEVLETISLEMLEAITMFIDMLEDMGRLVALRSVSMDELPFESLQRFVPQSRISCGRHCTLPIPFASKLSTQFGKAPVLI